MIREFTGMALLATGFVLAGCATAGATTATAPVREAAQSERAAETGSAAQAQRRVTDLEGRLQARDAEVSQLKSQLATRESGQSSDLFPPDAKPGQCYARVLTPERYRTSEERVLVQEESEKVEIIPARFVDAEERVLVKEASSRIEIVPATYETVTERVEIKPASTKIVNVPATFKTVTERVLDKPAYTVWKRGPASSFTDPVLDQSVSGTGEVMCLVEVPATYKTITRKVVDVPASTREVKVPAEYATVEKRVLKTPATTREVKIPAEYKTVKVTKLAEPEKERRIKIPAEYRTVERSEKIADARLDWQQVLCQVNATPDNVVALQRALEKQGYDVGPIDGVLGRQTLTAVSQFAKKKGIAHGANYVPMDVLAALILKF